jgi:hypothetical protein
MLYVHVPATPTGVQWTVPASNYPWTDVTAGVRLSEVCLEPSEVFAVLAEFTSGQETTVAVDSAGEIGLSVEGDEVSQSVVVGVPHVGGGATFLVRHMPASDVRRVIVEVLPKLMVRDAIW